MARTSLATGSKISKNKPSIKKKNIEPKKENKKNNKKELKEIPNDNQNNKKKNNRGDNRILEVKTTQTGAFKQVIERIANVISDCSIMFVQPDESYKNSADDDYYEEIDEENESKNKSKKSKIIAKKKNIDTDDDNDEENDIPKKNRKTTRKTARKKDDDDDEDESEIINKKKTTTKKSVSKRKNVDTDDESEEENEIKPKKTSNASTSDKTKKKNTGGIRILRLTEDKSILIKLNLDAIHFEHFRCDEPKITIGVDMHMLHALLKMVNDDDPIILYMNRDNRSALYIRSLNENNESTEETDIEIYLMEIGNPEMPIPQTEFQNKITMASDKFHTICKHLNNNSTFVEITSINNEILFRGQNEGGKVTMSYKDINYNSKKKDKPDQVVQGVYELRNLMGFSKCNKLCSAIEIYLKNDFPLVLVISVASLGKMYVFLSPIENANN